MTENLSDLNAELHQAIILQKNDRVKALLKLGANPNLVYQSQPPLHWAACYPSKAIITELLNQGADIDIRDTNYQETALFKALRYGQNEIARFLLTQGAKTQIKNAWGETPLHLAASRQDLDLVQNLLGDGRHINQRTYFGQTPLHQTAMQGSLQMVKFLIEKGANPNKKNNQGLNALLCSVFQSKPEIFAYLRPLVRRYTAQTRLQALKLALQYLRVEMVAYLLKPEDLKTPLGPEHPLLLALKAGHTPLLDLLKKQGADLNAFTPQAETPLHLATEANWLLGVDWLLKNGANPLARNAQGQTALAKALQQGNLPLSEKLLKGWQNPDLCLAPGESSLALAKKAGSPEIARLLLMAGAQIQGESAKTWVDNTFYLQKSMRLMVEPGSSELPLSFLVGLQKNIESLGFILSPALAERILTLSESSFKAFYVDLIPLLQKAVGAHKVFQPMYPNFPDQVQKMPDWELHFNALRHYWGDAIGQRIMPHYAKQERPPLAETSAFKQLDLGNAEDFLQIFVRLQKAKIALSPEDKQLLEWFVFSRRETLFKLLEAQIPLRENAALLAAALLTHLHAPEQAVVYLTNSTDVLRLATVLSKGDVSLAEKTKFISFSKAQRRFLLAQFERMQDLTEALQKRPEIFKRLAERLHPGEYAKAYPQTFAAFQALRQGRKQPCFGRALEMALAEKNLAQALKVLTPRPGELARRLDHLLRISQDPGPVLKQFEHAAKGLPSALLLQVMAHFEFRPHPPALRVFFPKGEVAKLHALDTLLPPLSTAVCAEVVQACKSALLAQYQQRPSLGKVYLDPHLKNFKVPFALRSASKALRTVARGSRVPLGPGSTLRFFIWWKDGKNRTDLDLSALALDQDFAYQTTLSYYNLKELGGCHSGDITSAPEGASEFIDLEIETFLKTGCRYVLMVVNSYTEQPYCDLPECFAGFMLRTEPNSGEIYEPRTVLNKFDLSANTKIALPLILDLEKREMIWTDLALKKNPNHVNNVHGNRSNLSLLCQAMTELQKPSLYQLLNLHIEARGERVATRAEAETIFALDQGITPWDTDQLISAFL
ncbi:hypothetical protein COW36_13915 [bacterium (Candidatus Blackallbacteria) CG17_big_fil_post_rev_8_21_14_2_50_48_46]|uniref:Uncharacterized protein n=1 Tax=bacterium (Candidatus Blackallbacteria) CG17_big_fil_post_rev_8_21_14_2_50_48_46 TaxID=2014261 RepID=A0A2M7G387_9BACT|nr:MAG: hypothetical protein COW64_23390 [bacterium (Candidatus Blackallbacteria) CG18_big_fil_WC_8_21_14_2_50_49_26]PIW16223.1 MAG: hypothetical protein COW36_13915 [bacterium (Candidatus Blackallbacteria) CG17_big_fil_post_rev_8_21_14_2_50_48_46]PIW49894.1 MAG: hypothetical protein COW20_04390 [bacterium (Candidatus Blackallbacteria) CG13_big_fil_rev_8_21_14_2_50_49_14]